MLLTGILQSPRSLMSNIISVACDTHIAGAEVEPRALLRIRCVYVLGNDSLTRVYSASTRLVLVSGVSCPPSLTIGP